MIVPNSRSAAWALPGLTKVYIEDTPVNALSAFDVIYKVCYYFGISEDTLFKKTKKTEIVYPRQLATYLMCSYTNLSLKEIASVLGFSDHTVVIHNRDKIKDFLSLHHEERVKKDINDIINICCTVGSMRTSLVGKIIRRSGRIIKVLSINANNNYECTEVGSNIIFEGKREQYDKMFLNKCIDLIKR